MYYPYLTKDHDLISAPLRGVTWGQVQRHLQETGHIFWRPSLKEKREAARRSAGLKPPDGKKMLAAFKGC